MHVFRGTLHQLHPSRTANLPARSPHRFMGFFDSRWVMTSIIFRLNSPPIKAPELKGRKEKLFYHSLGASSRQGDYNWVNTLHIKPLPPPALLHQGWSMDEQHMCYVLTATEWLITDCSWWYSNQQSVIPSVESLSDMPGLSPTGLSHSVGEWGNHSCHRIGEHVMHASPPLQ